MRVAALHDIHGNLPALEAVLADVEAAGVDRIVLGGDLSLGPMPTDTLDLLWGLGDRVVALHGNTDREQVAAFDGGAPDPRIPDGVREATIWAGRVLERRHRDYLAGLPPTLKFDVDGVGKVLFCHATPQNDVDVFTAVSAEDRVAPMLAGVDADVVVCGHTHMQFDRRVGGVRVVNAGSVGMPFAEPGAYWLLLGPAVELRRTAYDLEAAAARIRATAYPMAEDFAANNVLRPPSAADVIARFEQATRG
ncbi:MAG: metallophosphoesterase family protein [Candidatus Dormibacteraeota bacterium]|nr:metallophosphoesterase family protein [Candidatus Dormibacteraeota bacterium]MBO0761682.1 metallophosphoesterase family protein [Candidatus Dormibacteraeota bacterium]